MGDLSVGEVSGLIAAAVFLLQVLVPLLVPLILIAYLTDQNPVVSWSVLSRFLHSSLWPSILSTDTAARHGVQRRINYLMWFQTAALGLISLASVMTPLGLYDQVEPLSLTSLETFQFIPDLSAFGYGTPPRISAPFTRSCGLDACPGLTKNATCVQKGLAQVCNVSSIDRSIPAPLVNLFRDGPNKFAKPVSSIFDIQWRTYLNASDTFGSARWYIKSAYRQVSMLIPQAKINVVDGLIVDTNVGGIGFRRHTVPEPLHEYGSKWTEDILYVEPETQCIDLNITFEFVLTLDDSTSDPQVFNLALMDHGGFSNLSRTMPSIGKYPNGQGDIDLRQRAYYAAWMANFLTMAYFNLTDRDPKNFTRNDAKLGPVPQMNSSGTGNTTFSVDYQSLMSSITYGEYLADLLAKPSWRNKTSKANPFGISKMDFNAIVASCTGTTQADLPNINSSLVGCGILYGAAQRLTKGSPLVPDVSSRWSIPIYSCASSVRAIVKTVEFLYNGTTIDALQVTQSAPKNYSNAANLPLWAVENVVDTTIVNLQPLWGIIGTSNASVPDDLKSNISTLAKESLRLPGVQNLYSLLESTWKPNPSRVGQYLPGVNFYTQALLGAYAIARPNQPGHEGLGDSMGDYSGHTNLAMFSKWRDLSASASKAASIINLVWADVAANAVVGTKGWGSSIQKRDSDSDSDRVPVTVYHKSVQYKIPFAVPAFIVIAVTVGVIAATISLSAMQRTGTGKLRRLLDTTSTGRTITIFLWPETAKDMKTDVWVKAVGKRKVTVSRDGAYRAEDDDGSEPEKDTTVEDSGQRPPEKSQVAVQQGLLDACERN